MKDVRFVLMDIEGTTTSISFVYEVLFPYFLNNIQRLERVKNIKQVRQAFDQVKEIVKNEENLELNSDQEIINKLLVWSKEDKKVTPLKTVQGVLWQSGYKNGEIVGHVYPEVPSKFMEWKNKGLRMGIFSSGSVAAQKLLFGYTSLGDLNRYLEYYFDTNTGSKQDKRTYIEISRKINFEPHYILFLSDSIPELQAAEKAGFQTIQLTRLGTEPNWIVTANDFNEIFFE
ncbi:MAG: acireductone synthase [Bacteroidetes bacterium]|nr:acireductone synthase [Bacteroidota bacterium]